MINETLLKSLIDKYLTGSLTDPERMELSDLLEQPDYQIVLENILTTEFENHHFEEAGHDKVLAMIGNRVRTEIARNRKGRIFFLPAWAAAAAVVALIVGSYLFIIQKSGKEKEDQIAQVNIPADITPGGNRAVLTLADGSRIKLDSIANGELATQGQTKIIKTDSGKLFYASNGKDSPENSLNTLTTPRGGIFQLTLPDGTKVWLNAASSITYPTSFTGAQRNVSITGEVYFEVAHDVNKPFIASIPSTVNHQPSTIEVLGTHFNVNSYSEESDIRTTLLEGSIKLKSGDYNTILKPGDQAQIGRNGKVDILQNEDMEQVMAWKTGYFNFKNADLPTVLKQLERWYNFDVKYEGEIPRRSFQGELPRSLQLSTMLNVLTEMKIKFRMENKTLIITN